MPDRPGTDKPNVAPAPRYEGRYDVFDPSAVQTYPLSTRPNKVRLEDLVSPAAALDTDYGPTSEQAGLIEEVAEHVASAHRARRPVVVITGAHLIKNGLGPLLIDLVRRGVVTLVATHAAGAIHDFELALVGQTSEDVPDALPTGKFGMAYEFAYMNEAINLGHAMHLGFGESLGRMICDASFQEQVLARVRREGSPETFAHAEASVLAATYACKVPMTVHASIGTDVMDQHASFDAAAKGGTSGRDFLIFTQHVTAFTNGAVVLNVGSAVTGPEVLLKAISMAANVGRPAKGLITADFDLRPHEPSSMTDASKAGYYYRDQKSIVTRIPQAVGGRGYYVQGDQRVTIPVLYQAIVRRLGQRDR